MTIETKYNIGEKVYIISSSTLKIVTVTDIQVKVDTQIKVYYGFSHDITVLDYPENQVFSTKQDLINSL